MSSTHPHFWWDFETSGSIVVEGVRKKGGEVEVLQRWPCPTTDEMANLAESLVDDFKSGRETPT